MSLLIRRRGEVEPTMARPFGSLFSWDPWRAMEDLARWDAREIAYPAAFVPAVEVKETKDAYQFKLDLPGLDEKDVELTVTGNVLRVSGERQEEKREENDRYHLTERSYGSFARAFTLPEGADVESVHAAMKDGVLTIGVGKRREVQPRKIALGKGDVKG